MILELWPNFSQYDELPERELSDIFYELFSGVNYLSTSLFDVKKMANFLVF